MNVRARRGFNSPGSGGKDMRRASRIITLVDGQRSCPHGKKHRPWMRVPAAEATGLKRNDLRGHINRIGPPPIPFPSPVPCPFSSL